MGEKKEKENGEAGKKKGDGEKKEKKLISIVLRIDMHCRGCTMKICKFLLRFPGVETVNVDLTQNKVTVNGIVEPLKIKEKLQSRTKKNVELISPQPKKGENQEKRERNQETEKKPKETPVTTTVLKVSFHCHGCTDKIRKIVSQTRGVHDFTMDEQKDQVTVKGTLDVKGLTEKLKEKLKRPVDIVPPKKEKGAGEEGGNGTAGGGKKKKNKNEETGEVGRGEMEGGQIAVAEMGQFGYKTMPVNAAEYGYGYWYGSGYAAPVHAPQLFSDDNPNACCVM